MWSIGNFIEFLITDPKDVEKFLTAKVQTKKANAYEYVKDWLGTGLLTSFGEPWFRMRRILTPAFHFKILESFIEVFNDLDKVLVEVLRDKAKSGGEVNIYDYLTRCALDNICGGWLFFVLFFIREC